MSEKTIFEGIIFSPWRSRPFGSTYRDYETLPELKSLQDICEEEALPGDSRAYVVPTEVLNSFLASKFGCNITDFMKMYGKTHLNNIGISPTDDDVELIVAVHPLPPKMVCFFEEADDPCKLSSKLANYQATVTEDFFGRSQLNLHDNSLRKFTLIRAKFSLETEKKNFYFGYHFTTEKFRYFIKSSAQFDLAIVYEEI